MSGTGGCGHTREGSPGSSSGPRRPARPATFHSVRSSQILRSWQEGLTRTHPHFFCARNMTVGIGQPGGRVRGADLPTRRLPGTGNWNARKQRARPEALRSHLNAVLPNFPSNPYQRPGPPCCRVVRRGSPFLRSLLPDNAWRFGRIAPRVCFPAACGAPVAEVACDMHSMQQHLVPFGARWPQRAEERVSAPTSCPLPTVRERLRVRGSKTSLRSQDTLS